MKQSTILDFAKKIQKVKSQNKENERNIINIDETPEKIMVIKQYSDSPILLSFSSEHSVTEDEDFQPIKTKNQELEQENLLQSYKEPEPEFYDNIKKIYHLKSLQVKPVENDSIYRGLQNVVKREFNNRVALAVQISPNQLTRNKPDYSQYDTPIFNSEYPASLTDIFLSPQKVSQVLLESPGSVMSAGYESPNLDDYSPEKQTKTPKIASISQRLKKTTRYSSSSPSKQIPITLNSSPIYSQGIKRLVHNQYEKTPMNNRHPLAETPTTYRTTEEEPRKYRRIESPENTPGRNINKFIARTEPIKPKQKDDENRPQTEIKKRPNFMELVNSLDSAIKAPDKGKEEKTFDLPLGKGRRRERSDPILGNGRERFENKGRERFQSHSRNVEIERIDVNNDHDAIAGMFDTDSDDIEIISDAEPKFFKKRFQVKKAILNISVDSSSPPMFQGYGIPSREENYISSEESEEQGFLDLNTLKDRGESIGGMANYFNQFEFKPKRTRNTEVTKIKAKKKTKGGWRGRGRGRYKKK
jgi:hypothetical protein